MGANGKVALPRIGDLGMRDQFRDGDRVIILAPANLTADQQRSLIRAVVKASGVELRVLIVDCSNVTVTHYDGDRPRHLAGPEDIEPLARHPGACNISLKRVELADGHKLIVQHRRSLTNAEHNQILRDLHEWAGPGIDVCLFVLSPTD